MQQCVGSSLRFFLLFHGLFFQGLALELVVGVDVAVLAFAFGVVHAIRVLAVVAHTTAPIPMVAVVAHTLSKVLKVGMRTVGDLPWPPTRLWRVLLRD
jgi:hypothetical protein